MDNAFEITVEADGKIKVASNGKFSPEQHKNADEFMEFIKNLAGGEVAKTKVTHGHTHSHGQQRHTH